MVKLKKLVSTVLSLALAVSLVQTPVIQALAEDNSQSQKTTLSVWAEEDVGMAYSYQLADKEIFKDYQNAVTREQLYTVSGKVYDKLTSNTAELSIANPFKDTENKDILKAYQSGLINDTKDGYFKPAELVSREEAAVALFNLIKKSEPGLDYTTNGTLSFTDSALVKESALKAVAYLHTKGLLKGKTVEGLALDDNLSREELLSLEKRIYEFVVLESGKASKGCFWKISGGKSQVYILGSIHMADMSLFPFSKSIEDAFSKADNLAVECDIKPSNDAIKYMAEKAVFSDGTTIDSKISSETYKQYAEFMKKFEIPESQYKVLKPWYAAMIIPSLSLSQSSISGSTGVDMYLMNRADRQGKKLIEIEGIKFQVDMFDNFSAELQESYLKSTLAGESSTEGSDSKNVAQLKQMLDFWKEGDIASFEKLIAATDNTEDRLTKEFNTKLFNDRNGNMGKKILDFLKDDSGKTYFVVVGAGHYFGDTGILKTLKDNGYTVEQLTK